MPHRILAALAVVLAAAIVATGCGGGSDADLTVYSGRSQELVEPLFERFEKETGLSLSVRYGDSADLALLIDEEGDRSPADVFVSQSPGSVAFLAGNDRLQPLPATTIARVDERLRSPEGLWVGVTARRRVLVYNGELLDESDLPASVLDLTDPAYRGKVGVAPTNGSFQDFVTALRQTAGEDVAERWLDGMAANDSPDYANNSAVVAAVARGEIPMGLVNHYYNFRARAENPDLPSRNHIFPNGDIGSVLLVSTASVVRGSDAVAEADRLVAFLLGREAQTAIAEQNFEYPVAAGVDPVDELPPIDAGTLPDYDIGRLSDLRRTVELIRESGLGG